MAQAKAKREYKKLFPGKAMPADRFASPELLVKQAADQPAGPLISIVVPLYNTPQQFLVELLDSVQNQSYRNWELCMVDAGQDETVGQTVKARAASDPRIRYRKLDKNDGIAGNTNQGFAMARATTSPCWTTTTSCIRALCGMWHRPSPSREPTSCIRTRSPLRATSTT